MSTQTTAGYTRYFYILASVVLTIFVLMAISPILNPLLMAFVVATIMKPISNVFERLGVPKIVSSALVLIMLCFGILILSGLFSLQVAQITNTLPFLEEGFNKALQSAQLKITQFLHLPSDTFVTNVNDTLGSVLKNSGLFLKGFLTTTASFLTSLLIFFISLFFFLYYRDFFIKFIYKSFDESKHPSIEKNIIKIKLALRKYIVGLFIVIFIIGILNSVGLMVLGIDHAIFFGFFGSFLTLIPYIGIIIGSLLPMLYASVTTDSLWYPFAVLVVFCVVQFLEGNFITPNIIGTRVNINPYIAILGLFIGGSILGMVGVILTIPLLGIIKIVCDGSANFQHIGYLLGNPTNSDKK